MRSKCVVWRKGENGVAHFNSGLAPKKKKGLLGFTIFLEGLWINFFEPGQK